MGKEPILVIDKPHFVVKVSEELLELDLKEGAKKELEDVVEAHPILRGSLGVLFQTIVPLDVMLHEVESVEVNDKGQLKLTIPLRRDITIPLDRDESNKLAAKLNELIPSAKKREAERVSRLGEAEERAKPTPREPLYEPH